MREHYPELLAYVQKMENKYGTVSLMDKWEQNYMLKLSKLCYRNEYANLNQYEIEVIKRYLSGDIIDRQLAYYLGGVTKSQALKMATFYANGRYELTQHKNYWER